MSVRATLAIVVLVSFAHALVHTYEMSLPTVEQEIAAEFYAGDEAVGKQFTGKLSNAWRLMWGIGAILAGWLVDRFGSHRLLVIYLVGCSATCAMAAYSNTQQQLFVSMVLMGGLASIYHPAGLALISHSTSDQERPRALGLHGIFGSAGIGLTPFAIGVLKDASLDWRQIYFLMLVPGLIVAGVIARDARRRVVSRSEVSVEKPQVADYRSFFVLTLVAAIQGFVYSGLMSFLVRYLDRDRIGDASAGHYLASGVLLLGCVGQFIAGRWAKPGRLEQQLTLVTFGNVPLLIWMALAAGWWRPVAAGSLMLVHFMHQPLYNSLIAGYTPPERRSLCYGFSFAMGLGLGSFGALFAGYVLDDTILYGALAAATLVGGLIALVLCWLNPREDATQATLPE